MLSSEKIKVPREIFAEVLYIWLSGYMEKKAIKKKAKELHFKIRGKKAFNKIFDELLTFNMWLIVYTCEGVFEDEIKRNECLDIFHHLVYDRHVENKNTSFNDWMMSNTPRYITYSTAMKTAHPSTPLWVVANKLNERLFGEINKDLEAQMKVIAYIGLFVKYLGQVINKYDIL